MRKLVSMVLAGLVLAGASLLSVGTTSSASAAGCDWYVYKTTKNTTYWEGYWGNRVNGGFWKHPDRNSRLKTNEPFNGKRRTEIKYELWYGDWRKLSATDRFPYINRGAVKYLYCY